MIAAALTLPVALVTGWLLLRQVVRTPRAGADAEQRGLDDAWRRRAATTIVATLGVLATGLLAGLAFAGAALFAQARSAVPAIAALEVAAAVASIGLYRYAAMLLAPATPPSGLPAPAPAETPQPPAAPELSLTNR